MRLNRALEGFVRWGAHEIDAFDGHWAELRERLAVARKARSVGELLRDQIDLLPETRVRLGHHHRQRKALLRDALGALR